MCADQDRVTLKGISPLVMCPSEARTCQRRRYSPAAKSLACAVRISAGVCLLISRACAEPPGPTRVSRERAASMRTLKRSLIGTSGPGTAALSAGLDSRSTACAAAEESISKNMRTLMKMSVDRWRRPGCMSSLFAGKGEKAPFELNCRQPEGIIPKLVGNGISALRKVKCPPDQVGPRIEHSLVTDLEEEMAPRMTSGRAGYARSTSHTLIYNWLRLRRSRFA